MTFRARPVVRRRGRAGWDGGDRRTYLINVAFVLAIAVSILILIGYAGWSWYQDHFGAAATVNGQVLTRDDLRERMKVESFRLDYVERRIQTLMALGRITPSDGAQQLDFLTQRRQQLEGLALDRLVDVTLMGMLAAERGVTVTDADIDAQLVTEATSSEQRHVWMIEIEPKPDATTGKVGAAEKAAAKAKADAALADLKAGKAWEDVAKTASTSESGAQNGDIGWVVQESGYDEAFMTAVFGAALNTPTDVVLGEDDVYRIGRVTEIGPEQLDPAYEEQILEAEITMEQYRRAVRGDVTRTKLSDSVVAELKQSGPQRHVLQIYLPEPNAPATGVEQGVKVRQVLYAPKDDPVGARDLPAEDPAWEAAKAEADAAYQNLKADPSRFDSLARARSDEADADITGGKQPWFYTSSQIPVDYKNAILATGLKPGDILAPVKTDSGWVVIQFLRPSGDGEEAWLEELKGKATDDTTFRRLARDNSEGEEAKDGGDRGWIAKGELSDELDAAILDTPVGSTSEVITIAGDGYYLLRVLAEETRTPTAEQIKIFENTGFSYWYTREKNDADITYATASSTGVS